MLKLDQTDKTLLKLLQTDSKQTTKELSNTLKLSVTAVYERIKKLEKAEVIKNYVALLDKKKIAKSFMAYCHVRLTQHSKDFVKRFEREVLKLDEVLECYHVSGDYDYILKVLVKDMEEYRDFMITKLTAIPNIGNTHSIFVIEEVKHTTAISV
ncbi:Lrp/AsnC family transcriptional regulator [Kordia sp.]|uniref:Lrp/AsnC family transcriptional regulator n=1 Tax=Kordia sp. TaxID=1965332 RepID=UPI003B595554